MLYIVQPPGIVYEGETLAQAAARDARVAAHNERVRAERERWLPAKGYERWCREHAPELLEPR